MISLILSLIFTANANTCKPVLTVRETAQAMERELVMLKQLATKLSDKTLANEIELARQGRYQDFGLVNFLGLPLIPTGLEIIAKRGNTLNETHRPFIELWEADIWTYVILMEYRERLKR